MPVGVRIHAKPRATLLLAAGARYEQVAEQIAVNERTVRRWAREPEFARQVRDVQAEVVTRAAARLADGMAAAAEVLVELLDDPDPRVRLTAAREVLTAAARVRDQQALEDRLLALERLAAGLADSDGGDR